MALNRFNITDNDLPDKLNYPDVILYNSLINEMRKDDFVEVFEHATYKVSARAFLNRMKNKGYIDIVDGRIFKLKENIKLTKEQIIFNEIYWELDDL